MQPISETEAYPYKSGDLLVEIETGLGANHQKETEKMSRQMSTHFIFYCFNTIDIRQRSLKRGDYVIPETLIYNRKITKTKPIGGYYGRNRNNKNIIRPP